jgi:hypothetical protein
LDGNQNTPLDTHIANWVLLMQSISGLDKLAPFYAHAQQSPEFRTKKGASGGNSERHATFDSKHDIE